MSVVALHPPGRGRPLVKPQRWPIRSEDVRRNCDALGLPVPAFLDAPEHGINIITREAPTIIGQDNVFTAAGPGASYSDTTSVGRSYDQPVFVSGDLNYTYLAVCQGYATGRHVVVGQSINGSPFSQWMFSFGLNYLGSAADGWLTFTEYDGGFGYGVGSDGLILDDGGIHVYAGVRNGTAASVGKIYQDGVDITTDTSGTGANTPAATEQVRVGNHPFRTQTDRRCDRPVLLVAVWPKHSLSVPQIQRVSVDWAELLAHPSTPITIDLGATQNKIPYML